MAAPKVLFTLPHWIIADWALLSSDGRIKIPRAEIGKLDRDGLLYYARHIDDWTVVPRELEYAFIVACGYWGLIIRRN